MCVRKALIFIFDSWYSSCAARQVDIFVSHHFLPPFHKGSRGTGSKQVPQNCNFPSLLWCGSARLEDGSFASVLKPGQWVLESDPLAKGWRRGEVEAAARRHTSPPRSGRLPSTAATSSLPLHALVCVWERTQCAECHGDVVCRR